MNHLRRFKQKLAVYTFIAILVPGITAVTTLIILEHYLSIELPAAAGAAVLLFVVSAVVAQSALSAVSTRPVEMLWQAIWHVSPDKSKAPAPKIDRIKTGRELISAMVMQIYDLASSKLSPDNPLAHVNTPDTNFIESMPLPVVVLGKDWNIRAINEAACQYIGIDRQAATNKGIHDVLHLSFTSDNTLDTWLEDARKNRATDSQTWSHVKLSRDGQQTKKFDLAASYSRDNSFGNEVVLVLFDKNNDYSVQEQATSYVALAVHELRTPLTMLRGYIELFEEELGGQLSDDHKEFMRKMSASAQNLTAFVNNILNVARIDEDQFSLTLREADWNKVLSDIIESLRMRAEVRGKRIDLAINPDLPKVGIDKISMYEVVTNLIENAIKYGGQSDTITVKAILGKDGFIETTVTDYGDGIPESVIGKLFSKFYRSHRSKNAVSGSGLGLYLVKSIVTAHGGNVWVKSKEGEGSTFGFSLVPYANISKDSKDAVQDGIERQASGWIKNHSLYRR